MGGMIKEAMGEAITGFFANIDYYIYSAISSVYGYIMNSVVNFELLKPQVITDMANRFYAILGIIILFFVGYRMVMFIVDPDAMFEKKKGAGSLINKIFLGLILTVAIPFLFDFSRRFQTVVIKSGIIERLIQGTPDGNGGEYNSLIRRLERGNYGKVGQDWIKSELKLDSYDKSGGLFGLGAGAGIGAALGWTAFGICSFVTAGGCTVAGIAIASTVAVIGGAIIGGGIGFTVGAAIAYADYLDAVRQNKNIKPKFEAYINKRRSEFRQKGQENKIAYLDDINVRFAKGVWAGFITIPPEYKTTNTQFRNFMMDAYPMQEIPRFIIGDKTAEGGWGYMTLIATLAGLAILWLMLTILFDLFIRSFKLAIIEITAPIFIAMYILDNSGERFKVWFQTAMGTYLMLFFKIGLITLVSWMIPVVVKSTENVSIAESTFLYIAFILSMLYFIQIAPKFIAKLFKFDESLLNGDGGKILKSAISGIGKASSTAVGFGVGAVAGGAATIGGAVTGAKTASAAGKNSALGFLSGGLNGVGAGLKGMSAATAAGSSSKNPLAALGAANKAAGKSVQKHYSEQGEAATKGGIGSIMPYHSAAKTGTQAVMETLQAKRDAQQAARETGIRDRAQLRDIGETAAKAKWKEKTAGDDPWEKVKEAVNAENERNNPGGGTPGAGNTPGGTPPAGNP